MSIGSIQARPSQRIARPRGASTISTPVAAAAICNHPMWPGARSMTACVPAHSMAGHNVSSSRAAAASSSAPSGGRSTPASSPARITGTTIAPTSGMTSALTNGDTRDCSAKTLNVTGARPTVTATCTVARVRSRPVKVRGLAAGRRPFTGRVASAATMAATATKDSQKPGARIAWGSAISTATSARASPCEGGTQRLESCDTMSTASISSARCVGSESPASSA